MVITNTTTHPQNARTDSYIHTISKIIPQHIINIIRRNEQSDAGWVQAL